MSYLIGVDLGGTNVRVALADQNIKIVNRISELVDKSSSQSVTNQIIRMINSAKGSSEISGIGIAPAGTINLEKGTLDAINISPKLINLLNPVRKTFRVPVKAMNDCCAAVLAEREVGVGKDYKNLVYVTLSTGIGCGIIYNDELIAKDEVNSLELGHEEVAFESEIKCPCGGVNHWEGFCSGLGIPNFAEYLLENKFSKERFLGELTAVEIFNAAKNKNKIALKIADEIGRINALALSKIIEEFSPELITIGGSIALNNQELVLRPLGNYLKGMAKKNPKIIITPLGEDAAILGAILLSRP